MGIQEAFGRAKIYAKQRRFHFMILIALAILGAIQVSQYALMWHNNQQIVALDNKVDLHRSTNKKNREIDRGKARSLAEWAKEQSEQTTRALGIELHARVDTIDSAIEPDLKRRALIKSVRDAIKENTDTKIDIRTLNSIAIAVIDNSYVYDLPIALVLAQMKQESEFNHKAVSRAEAKGLMQIIDATADDIARELGKKRYNIWNINTNVEFGCYYLSKMLHVHHNNLNDALRSYNFGPHNVIKVKAGEADYSLSRVEIIDGAEKQFLVNRFGEFILDDSDNRIEVREEHRYPKETRLYIRLIRRNIETFGAYGLDKVE